MKKNFVLAAAVAMLAMAFTVSAQKAPADFSGTWNLDTAKGSLGPQGASIKSQTLTIKQEGNKLTVSTKTERNAPPADAAGGRPAGGGGGGMGGMGGGAGDQTYTLDGKEVTVDSPGPGGATIPVKTTGKWDGSKAVINTSRTMTGQDGTANTTTTKITYELGADGKSLTVTRDSESPRGKSSTTSVYSKG